MNDWRERYIVEFCQLNNVTLQIDDMWKSHQKRVVMRRGGKAVTRLIDYDVIPTLLVTPLLHEMFVEMSLGESPVEVDECTSE